MSLASSGFDEFTCWLFFMHRENFQIESTKGPITLQGVSAITTVIQYGLYAEIAGTTAKTCTVCVNSDKFIAQDITIAVMTSTPLD